MGKAGKTGEIPGKASLEACGPSCRGLMPSNSGLVAVEMSNLMAGDKFRSSCLSTAPSFARENDRKRLVWSFITLNLEKVCIWRFSTDDISMSSLAGPGYGGDVAAEV